MKEVKEGDLAWKIRTARQFAMPALRQEDLARRVRMSRALIGMFESGERKPKPEAIAKIAAATMVRVAWFYDGDSTPPVREAAQRMQDFGQCFVERPPSGPTLGASGMATRVGWRSVPVYGPPVVGGDGSVAESIIERIDLPDWGNPMERWGLLISNPEMAPDFEIGDVAIFERRTPADGLGVFAARGAEAAFRKFEVRSETGWLVALDGSMAAVPAADWDVQGVAVMRIRRKGGGIVEETRYSAGYRAP